MVLIEQTRFDHIIERIEDNGKKKRSGHEEFRTKLAQQLMSHSSSSKHTLPIDGQGVRTNLQNVVKSSVSKECEHVVLSKDGKFCKACQAAGRMVQQGTKRKALEELSINSIQIGQNGEKKRQTRPPRTRYGCSICQIHLCKEGNCWVEHLQAKN